MKISLFEQAPYRYLPADFEERFESVCSTPYSLVTADGVYASIRDFMDELMLGARPGFDAIAVTEHGQSSYDMVPNPDLVASALAYATEAEGLHGRDLPDGPVPGQVTRAGPGGRGIRHHRHDERRQADRRLPDRAELRRQPEQRRATDTDPAAFRREPPTGAAQLAGHRAVRLERALQPVPR